MILLAMDRPGDAIESFRRLLAVKPDFTQVHLLRAKLLTDVGDREAALDAIEKLLAIAPGLAEIKGFGYVTGARIAGGE